MRSAPTVFSILPHCFFTEAEAHMNGPIAAAAMKGRPTLRLNVAKRRKPAVADRGGVDAALAETDPQLGRDPPPRNVTRPQQGYVRSMKGRA